MVREPVTYRYGAKLGRTLYRDDELIGLMDTHELATMVVAALNRRDAPSDTDLLHAMQLAADYRRRARMCDQVLSIAAQVERHADVCSRHGEPQKLRAMAHRLFEIGETNQ